LLGLKDATNVFSKHVVEQVHWGEKHQNTYGIGIIKIQKGGDYWIKA